MNKKNIITGNFEGLESASVVAGCCSKVSDRVSVDMFYQFGFGPSLKKEIGLIWVVTPRWSGGGFGSVGSVGNVGCVGCVGNAIKSLSLMDPLKSPPFLVTAGLRIKKDYLPC